MASSNTVGELEPLLSAEVSVPVDAPPVDAPPTKRKRSSTSNAEKKPKSKKAVTEKALSASSNDEASCNLTSTLLKSSVYKKAVLTPSSASGVPSEKAPTPTTDESFENNELGSVDDLPAGTIMCMRTTQTQQWR